MNPTRVLIAILCAAIAGVWLHDELRSGDDDAVTLAGTVERRTASYDFGIVRPKSELVHRFEIPPARFDGSRRTLKRAWTGCGCSKVTVDRADSDSNDGQGSLSVTVSASAPPQGMFQTSAFVEFEGEAKPAEFVITALTHPNPDAALLAIPHVLVFSAEQVKAGQAMQVVVYYSGDPVSADQTRWSSPDGIRIRLVNAGAINSNVSKLTYDVTVDGNAIAMPSDHTVRLTHPALGKKGEAELLVRLTTERQVRVVPSAIIARAQDRGGRTIQFWVISTSTTLRPKRVKISVESSALDVIEQNDESWAMRVTCRCPSGISGLLRAKVVVEMATGETQSIEVPIWIET